MQTKKYIGRPNIFMERDSKSILEMARGAIMERVDYEMSRIVDNIMDANTKATAKRKLVVTVVLQPDDERANIVADVTAKSTLAATNPVRTSLYVAGDPTTGEMSVVEMVPQVPGQMGFDDSEQEAPAMLRLVK